MVNEFYNILDKVKMPKMVRVKQKFPNNTIKDLEKAISDQLEKNCIKDTIKPNMRIAITAGSRGTDRIHIVIKTIVNFVKAQGAIPFIVPAMGSHGGATAQGQVQILKKLGVTEEFCGCPIVSSMETVKISTLDNGLDVYIDRNAQEADGIIVVNKIKPHTAFRGDYESGIMKMLTIGLGKQYAAKICHQSGFKEMATRVPQIGKSIIKNANILFALGLIENAYSKIYKAVAMMPNEIEEMEPKLLLEAKESIGKILLPETDLLVVDRIGKNISGDGMDPNVTGTFATPYANGGIVTQKVAVLDLTPETGGIMIGAGVADTCNKRIFDKADLEDSYINALTSTVFSCVKLPMMLKNDWYTIAACISALNDVDLNNIRMIRIKDSLHLDEILVSEAHIKEVKQNDYLEIVSEPFYMEFNEEGNLF